ncbi:transporter [Neptunitalea chrysea]|uniref:Transporter n=1 Tax=Neptunitalea chrysea TaxID=1647581 RepID=A0A9W6EV22_9FLAO|nr:TolC family protein [Neptunitalea chrysea]GLB51023.1 transporter [Neptunitalea chrysea]
MYYSIPIKKILVLSAFFIASVSWSQEKKWTLMECVNYALENNISVKQSTLDLRLTDSDLLAAKGNFIPNLSFSGTYTYNPSVGLNQTTNTYDTGFSTFNGGGTSSINLSSGLTNWRTLQRAKLNKIATQYSLDGMKDDIVLMVANAYVEILSNKEQLKVLEVQSALTKENLERTQELINAGSLPAGDIYDLQATQASQEQQIIVAQNTLLISKIGLAQTLLIKDYADFDIVDEEFEVPLDIAILDKSPKEISDKAKEVLNTIKVAQSNLELAKIDQKLAKGAYYPTLSGFFSYNTRWSSLSNIDFMNQLASYDGIGLGMQLSIPVLNGFSTRANVQRSKINTLRAENALEQSKLDLEKNVYQAYMDASNAKKLYEASLKTLEARRQAFNFTEERYNVGLLNSYDYNQSKTDYESAQSDVVRNKYDYIFKLKVLEFYFGIPVTAN